MTLAPIPRSDISVIYNNRVQCIELIAKGRLPGNYYDLSFAEEEETWDGILIFSLSAQTHSFGHDFKQPYEAKHRLFVNLPQSSLVNKSVLVQTALATWEIPVHHDNPPSSRSPILGPSSDPSLGAIRPRTPSIRPRTPSIRPRTPAERPHTPSERSHVSAERSHSPSQNRPQPILKSVGEEQTLYIQAEIPDATSDVWAEFDSDVFKIISTSVNHSVITWIFHWKRPHVQHRGMQGIDIHTRSRRSGPNPVIQRYLVEEAPPTTKIRAKPIPRYRRREMVYQEPVCV